MMSGNVSNSTNSTNSTETEKKNYPDWYPLPAGAPEFIPPTMYPYIPQWEIVLLIQIYMPWANDLVLPMNCNRLAPVRDIIATACFKMKVSNLDCYQNSIYTLGFFQIGFTDPDAEVIDISQRPVDIDLGGVNRTVITWVR